jgi:hypothetical protein
MICARPLEKQKLPPGGLQGGAGVKKMEDQLEQGFIPELMELNLGQSEGEDQTQLCTKCDHDVQARCLRRKDTHVYRRAFSESKLLDILDPVFSPGTSYHCISGGDIDSLSYLKHIIRQQDLRYLLFSTWCMADDDVLQFGEWVDAKKIARVDAYCGEIFPGSYSGQHKALVDVVRGCGGRCCIFRNHAKIYAGIGDKFAFAIESSANINTNPRTENTTITVGDEVFRFYKDFFDGIKSFRRDFDTWTPWQG